MKDNRKLKKKREKGKFWTLKVAFFLIGPEREVGDSEGKESKSSAPIKTEIAIPLKSILATGGHKGVQIVKNI